MIAEIVHQVEAELKSVKDTGVDVNCDYGTQRVALCDDVKMSMCDGKIS